MRIATGANSSERRVRAFFVALLLARLRIAGGTRLPLFGALLLLRGGLPPKDLPFIFGGVFLFLVGFFFPFAGSRGCTSSASCLSYIAFLISVVMSGGRS